jgi:adenylate kinase
MLAGLGRAVNVVLFFDADSEELVRRLSGRTTCDVCQTPFTGLEPGGECPKQDGGHLVRRKDDEPDAIRRRLEVYDEQTAPVIAWYERHGIPLRRIDGLGALDDVTQRATDALRGFRKE